MNAQKLISDELLTEEALTNFTDLRDTKINNIEELLGIYIARTEEQFNSLELKVKDIFKSEKLG